MTKGVRVPVPVENLRRIWNLKKGEMQITQAQAAETLGWTQGAFSQYLNNITDLNPAAVIKLANFLGVDPAEIDPNIDEALPHVHRKEVRFLLSDATKINRDAVSVNSNIDTFCIRVDIDCPHIPQGCMLTVCKPNKNDYIPRTSSNEPLYVVQLKGETHFAVLTESNLPAANVTKRKYLVLSINTY